MKSYFAGIKPSKICRSYVPLIQYVTLLCRAEAWILMKAQASPQSSTKLPQAGKSLQVEVIWLNFTQIHPQQGEKILKTGDN